MKNFRFRTVVWWFTDETVNISLLIYMCLSYAEILIITNFNPQLDQWIIRYMIILHSKCIKLIYEQLIFSNVTQPNK